MPCHRSRCLTAGIRRIRVIRCSPVLAGAVFRTRLIEQWSTGALRMIAACRPHGIAIVGKLLSISDLERETRDIWQLFARISVRMRVVGVTQREAPVGILTIGAAFRLQCELCLMLKSFSSRQESA